MLQKVFVNFDDEFEVKIASVEIKFNDPIFRITLNFVIQYKGNISELFKTPSDYNFDNNEYALMTKALIQLVNESIRLNEPIFNWLAH